MLLLLACHHPAALDPAALDPATPRRAPASGPVGTWEEVPLDPAVAHYNRPRLHAAGESAWLLVDDRLYRSDDHGSSWAVRSQELLEDFALLGGAGRLLGWSGNQEAPLMASDDDGRHWYGRPVTTYSGDQVLSTGAIGSPSLLRVFGEHTVLVAPGRTDALLVSETPPEGFVAGNWQLSPEFLTYAAGHNLSTTTYPHDVGALGETLFACASSGVFRSVDHARTWRQIPNPDGGPDGHGGCTFTSFDTLICVALSHWGGQRLYCSADGDTWKLADHGLYEETPLHPQWASYVGLSYIQGSAQAGDRFFLAHRGDNPYAPTTPGLFTTTDPFGTWSRVEEVAGEVLGIATTAEVLLVLTGGEQTAEGSTPLRLWRYRW